MFRFWNFGNNNPIAMKKFLILLIFLAGCKKESPKPEPTPQPQTRAINVIHTCFANSFTLTINGVSVTPPVNAKVGDDFYFKGVGYFYPFKVEIFQDGVYLYGCSSCTEYEKRFKIQ